ncbi:hypothetical protein ACIBCM_16570 [Streptomyces sp. NPDC051018]|uniref:hypothetical protein n=1 Tax=Streptomyces sp. NPDC051018 TaxID=3365639 RepID=UPI00379CA470
MKTLLSGDAHVHYGQIYVESDPEGEGLDLDDAFAGQAAGLCGAAIEGALWLTTGLHTGHVGFTVELHETRPPYDDAWEEIVEAPFTPASDDTCLVEWAGGSILELGLGRGDYRVRYCATGMDAGRAADTRLEGEPPMDRYLLQFWPGPPAPARVLKQTGDIAAYWHRWARELPPPPPPEAVAERKRLAALESEEETRRVLLEAERLHWGGRPPSRRLRAVEESALGLLALDPGLVHRIDAADRVLQSTVARLAARRACVRAGLGEAEWLVPALEALDGGRRPPPPFDDPDRVWELLESDPRLPDSPVVSPRGDLPRLSQPHMAISAVLGAAEADPLRAALAAVHAAAYTYGGDHRTILDEIHALLPEPKPG